MSDQEKQYKQILDNLYDGVYFVDRERQITFWNKGAERITGYPAGQILGRRCMDNILNHVTENGTQLCLNGCPLHATMLDGIPREAEVFLHHADGHRLPVLIRTSPIRDPGGQIIGAVETFSDNTTLLSSRRRIHRLEESILLDPLTGIGNRRFIDIRLRSAISEFQQHRVPCGLLFIDVDNFKSINDARGHPAGDRVLIMVARTLLHNTRSDDTIARWGGDEFLVLLAGVDRDGMRNVAEKLHALIRNSPIQQEDREITVTVSIGATQLRFEDDPASLIHRADQAMYRSKLSGRDRITDDPSPESSD